MKRGLTLIELVVVVGIVLILVALVTSSVSSVIARAEERQTKTGMELFTLAIQPIAAAFLGLGFRTTLMSLAPPFRRQSHLWECKQVRPCPHVVK